MSMFDDAWMRRSWELIAKWIASGATVSAYEENGRTVVNVELQAQTAPTAEDGERVRAALRERP